METELSGGITSVQKVGNTVRRGTGPWSPAAHAVLQHLEAVGFAGAPRFLGVDEQGREILSFIDGVAPRGADPALVTNRALEDVGRLMRDLHEATSQFSLPPALSWNIPPLGGAPPHVVCHRDLSPKNSIFRDGRAVAFVDWDLVTLDPPIHDVVHAAWQFVPLMGDEACARHGWSQPPDRCRRLRLLVDAYGLPASDRLGFAKRVADRMEDTASGIEGLASLGRDAFARLVADGVPAQVRQDRTWVLEHAAELNRALRD